mgnify:CR=1 FL=1
MEEHRPIAVLGCGLIGESWAALFMAHGYDVRAWDPSPEVLAGFASALLLVVVVAMLAFESLWRLWQPQTITFDMALWVAVIGLLVNLVSAWLLSDRHDHAQVRPGPGGGLHVRRETGRGHAAVGLGRRRAGPARRNQRDLVHMA